MTIASGTCGDNLTWTLNDDYSLVITGSGAMNNYTSTSSGRAPWYSYRTQMTSLTLPNGLTSIGNYAFQSCTGFTGALTIPSSVTSIGNSAFYSCTGFTGALTIPSSVTSIGSYAFYYCTGLTGTLTIPSSVTSIKSNTFGYTGFTGTLTIPSSVTSIEGSAFYGCAGFTGSLTIPSSVTSIKTSTFRNCSGFTSLTIPSSVTSIESYAFYSCYGLTEVILKQSTAPTMGSNCFALGDSGHIVTATVKSTDNWAASVLDSYKGSYTTFTYKDRSIIYKHLTYDSNKIQVDSAIRDGEGVKISTNYAKKSEVPNITISTALPSGGSDGDIWIQY